MSLRFSIASLGHHDLPAAIASADDEELGGTRLLVATPALY